MIITRLIKLGNVYHAIVLDSHGEHHHEKFYDKGKALEYIEGHYHDHRAIISYRV